MNRGMDLRMVKRYFCLMIVITVIFAMFGTVSANSLPEPTIHLSTLNAPKGRDYFIVMFHEPHAGLMDNYFFDEDDKNADAVAKLNDFLSGYEDPDGLTASSTTRLNNGNTRIPYYGFSAADRDLRIMVYYPDNGEYVISDIFHIEGRYEEYSVDLSGTGPRIKVRNYTDTYNRKNMILVMALDLAFTLVAETGLAIAMGYKSKKEVRTIFLTNVATNMTANVLIFIFIKYFVFFLLLLEAGIIAVEYSVYKRVVPKERKRSTLFAYVLGANLFSALFGIFATGLVYYFIKM